jgi:hypothetical protein
VVSQTSQEEEMEQFIRIFNIRLVMVEEETGVDFCPN